MDYCVRLILLSVAILLLAKSQSEGAPSVARFEVASIKRCDTAPQTRIGSSSPGRIRIDCFSVKNLILRSYVRFANGKANPFADVPIEGGPAWADSDLYTINAKAAGTPNFGQMTGPMMQVLLEDRFKLKIHRRPIEISIYALSIAKGGPRLSAAKVACVLVDFDHPLPNLGPGQTPPPACDNVSGGEHTMDVRGATLEQFGHALSNRSAGRPVIDKTGIGGHFDFHLDFSRFDQMPSNPDVSREETNLDAMRAALSKYGLTVVPAKGPGEAIVIDHLERPSEN